MPPAGLNCKFTKKLSQEFPFIKPTKFEDEVTCTKCQSTFSITLGGRRDITRHLTREKYKKHINAAASSSVLTNYYRNDTYGTCERKLAISEALFAYHAVAHNRSFRSMDCTLKIKQKRFENKFTCARTKSEAIIKRVIAPFAFDTLTQELETSPFVSIFSDASNHKGIKLFPTLVRSFNTQNGISIKIIDVTSMPGETAEIISNLLLKFSDISCFEWTDLNQCVEWENVQKTLKLISEHFTANDIDESALFGEITLIKNYATEQKIKEWQEMKTLIDLRWVEIFKHFDVQQI
ncbi:hypothetical protein ILUMI_09199 [Ignelater luminosus]|uniref:Uncharacterized protein n=1 Tax=Ignelater luminosus TaxID=2038154 RepID=A0A8K0D093_IGNLU|nr:hypothetical protein ILUMI_09199 [Ignelater luminosus]